MIIDEINYKQMLLLWVTSSRQGSNMNTFNITPPNWWGDQLSLKSVYLMLMMTNTAFRLACRSPHCRFDGDYCTTAAEGRPSGKQRHANKSTTLPLCPQRQTADSWILFNSGAMPLGDKAKAGWPLRAVTLKQQAMITRPSGKAASGKLVWNQHKLPFVRSQTWVWWVEPGADLERRPSIFVETGTPPYFCRVDRAPDCVAPRRCRFSSSKVFASPPTPRVDMKHESVTQMYTNIVLHNPEH